MVQLSACKAKFKAFTRSSFNHCVLAPPLIYGSEFSIKYLLRINMFQCPSDLFCGTTSTPKFPPLHKKNLNLFDCITCSFTLQQFVWLFFFVVKESNRFVILLQEDIISCSFCPLINAAFCGIYAMLSQSSPVNHTLCDCDIFFLTLDNRVGSSSSLSVPPWWLRSSSLL